MTPPGGPGLLQTFGFSIPLKHPLRGVTESRGILVSGPAGWGEYSPVPGYSDGRQHACWRAAVASASEEKPVPVREWVPVAVLVPDVSAERAAQIVRGSGCDCVKVKVASGNDEARVEAVRDALGPSGKLRIDANAGWSVDEAARRVKALSRYDLEFVEQPVATVEEMARLRCLVDVPLAADELVGGPEAARSIALHGAADALVLKVQHLGGVRKALETAEAGGLPAVVSSLTETSVGIAAGLLLACCLHELPYACGLGASALLESDLAADPLAARDGFLRLRDVAPDPGLLQRYSAEVAVPS